MLGAGWELAIRTVALVAIASGVLGGLAAAGLALAIHPPRYVDPRSPADLGWEFERVAFRAADGPTLKGWYIPAAGEAAGRPAIVVLHGYPFDKGNILGVTQFLHRDYDLLLFDARYFGESEGHFTTVGYREATDVALAVDYLRSRGVASIGLWGISMGAATALLAMEHTDGVYAVVADSSYADLHTMTLDYYFYLPLVNRALAFFTDLIARITFQVGLADVSPERVAARSQVPLLLIHGTMDSTIPIHHFDRLSTAVEGRSNVALWRVEGAGHARALSLFPAAYEQRLHAFFGQHLRGMAA
jgi:uncharacterized protein